MSPISTISMTHLTLSTTQIHTKMVSESGDDDSDPFWPHAVEKKKVLEAVQQLNPSRAELDSIIVGNQTYGFKYLRPTKYHPSIKDLPLLANHLLPRRAPSLVVKSGSEHTNSSSELPSISPESSYQPSPHTQSTPIMTTEVKRAEEHAKRMKESLFRDIGKPLKDPFFQLYSSTGGDNEYIRSGNIFRADAARKQLQSQLQPQLPELPPSPHNYPCNPIPIPVRKRTKALPSAYHKTITSSPGISPPGKPMNAPSELAIRMKYEDPLKMSPQMDLGLFLERHRIRRR